MYKNFSIEDNRNEERYDEKERINITFNFNVVYNWL